MLPAANGQTTFQDERLLTSPSSTSWSDHRSWARLVLAALLVAAVGCGSVDRPIAPAEPEPLKARRGRFEDVVLLTGEVVAARSAHVIVPFTPTWQLFVSQVIETGTPVARGEPLVELSNAELSSDLENKEFELQNRLSELDRARAEAGLELRALEFAVRRARAELEKARIRADIPAHLVADKELAERRLALVEAQATLEDANTELEARRRTSEIDLELDRMDIDHARREIAVARKAMADLSLKAPEDGLFLVADHPWEDRKIQEGDRVWAGLTVGTIPDLNSLQIEARLPDVDDGRITPGMPARVVLDASPDIVLDGRVLHVAPIPREEGRNSLRRFFDVKVSLQSRGSVHMIPGMSARIEVIRETRDDAVLAPRRAVRGSPHGETTIRTRAEDRVAVILGPCDPLVCVVERGLRAGDLLLPATDLVEAER